MTLAFLTLREVDRQEKKGDITRKLRPRVIRRFEQKKVFQRGAMQLANATSEGAEGVQKKKKEHLHKRSR